MSAADTVLTTPELLETILVHLPPSQLLSAHLISRTFAAAIQASPPLRRTLWLSPRLPVPPGAPVTHYNFNPLLAAHTRALGIYTLLQWNLDKRGGLIVDVYWRSWAHVVDPPPRSSDHMLVLQPPGEKVEVSWSVGFYEGRRAGLPVGREERKREWTFGWEDGRLPTLGMLRAAVVERFGVVDWSPAHEEKGVVTEEGVSAAVL
ncbi:hypothetical protein B0A54_15487 [Friedmanniomyces endolithicus]|uniref:F-box domain-containing protein n=1 Tax=Friedmanniomyces endolithicus TaxID=329885 RepID=A0A4U0UB81_9PEZI|nr:hypothetical protein LTS09_011175 [Friedmanniomyces endolithicus]KAK0311329.1 hypothetical protein LTR01_003324 [Friedmanniomyces endolithicus]KAK0828662.1 hypothetical protein LTR73_004972 [Friedmanniomyces endolithicus]TKA32683.1 hypothetical protein B0A54_15487 [Friedmanniomyces endolithicus]